MIDLRDNWRIILLVVLVVLSAIALFGPGGGGTQAAAGTNATTNGTGSGNATATDDGLTNLRFGLELSGGTRLRADLVGVTAENVPMTQNATADIRQTVAESLDLDQSNVSTQLAPGENQGAIELYTARYTTDDADEIRAAIGEAGVDTSDVTVRDGVTQDTWDVAQRRISQKINEGGLSGGTASLITTPGGENFLVVEVPNANRESVVDLVGQQGRVQIVATYPVETDNGTEYREEEVLTGENLVNIGPARDSEGQGPHVSGVQVQEGEPAQRFAEVMNERGFTGEGAERCRWTPEEPENPGYCLKTVVDGETVDAHSMSESLGNSIRSGSWLNNRVFILQTPTLADAQELQVHLAAGALPTELDIQSQMFLQPSLAQKFKPLALLTGIVAWLVVAGVIFYRYREPRVAVPMLLTAFAEVWILLGFAVAVGLPLDLSHIAGFIAVIGTGVDDLVIIADEIMQRGEIATDRVFKSRFRKAFWVIGAAAITTIIAMSPLAVLSLGDLQGFAIVTIVGVLIGVLITRPAYGDVLRKLLLDDSA